MKYTVTAVRTTVYEVEADSEDEAIDLMIEGKATEVDGLTSDIRAERTTDDESEVQS